VAAWPQLEAAGIAVLAIGIGDEASRQRFCAFTGFPSERLQVDAEPQLNRALRLYKGLRQIGGP
jgi:peroxiredoxin